MGISLPILGVPGLLGGQSALDFYDFLAQKYGGLYYDMREGSGATLAATNTALAVGRDVVINGAFASDTIWTKGTGWSIAAGVATHASGSAGDLTQASILAASKSYSVTFTVTGRTAGTITAKCGTQAGTARGTNDTFTETIVSDGADLVFSADAAFDGSVDNVSVTQLNIPANDSNMNASITGATWATGPQTGVNALSFDGATDYVNWYSAELNSFFDPTQGTIIVPAKVSGAGVWTDSTQRYIIRMAADTNNYVYMSKNSTDNQILTIFKAGGTTEIISAETTYLDWMLLSVSWGANFRLYINGTEVAGSPQAIAGAWSGNLAATTTIIGAAVTTPSAVWSGSIGPVLLMRDAITPAEHKRIAQLFGVYGG